MVAFSGLLATAADSGPGPGPDTESCWRSAAGTGTTVPDSLAPLTNWAGTVPWVWGSAARPLSRPTPPAKSKCRAGSGCDGLVVGGLATMLGISRLEYKAGKPPRCG